MRQPLNVDKVIIESLAARVQELSCLLSEEVKDKEHFQAECLRYEKLLNSEKSTAQGLRSAMLASAKSKSGDSIELQAWKEAVRDMVNYYYPPKGSD